jgi:serine/threonine protein kinase
VKRYLEAAEDEVEILRKIKKADVHKESLCVRLISHFEVKHRDQRHYCLGFEKLGRSLYEFCKKNKHRGFGPTQVKCFAYQLLQSVGFCHSIKLTHTDLKPENILLLHSDYRNTYREKNRGGAKDYRVPLSTDIRLIDFGGATFESDHHSRIVNTRQYRSPEVLLGLGWSHPSDMWSIGCILGELLTGDLLFSTHEDMEHLALMEKLIGKKLPAHMTDKALQPYREAKTTEDGGGGTPAESRGRKVAKKERRDRSSSKPLVDKYLDLESGRLKWPENASGSTSKRHVEKAKTIAVQFKDDPDFVDLMHRLLTFDPEKRITAAEALKHPYFDEQVRAQYPSIGVERPEPTPDRDHERSRDRSRSEKKRGSRSEDSRRSGKQSKSNSRGDDVH